MHYVPSHFISMTFDEDGSLVIHSSATGAIGVVPPENAERVRALLKPGSRTADTDDEVVMSLVKGGILVPESRNEHWESEKRYVQRYRDDRLELIIMPTEDCNFRCVYCYESFLRGTMSQEVQDSIVALVASKPNLKQLTVAWFGGEPLVAGEVVVSLMERLDRHCRAGNIRLTSHATTNGYLLTPELATRVIGLGVKNFQITLDGLAHDHDKRRVGAHGEKTFDTIMQNLRFLHASDLDFTVMIRHNFDPDSLINLDEYLDMLAAEFAGDGRFRTSFEAIGRWGGESDDNLVICEDRDGARAISRAKHLAQDKGLRDAATLYQIQPGGSACYAANPNSFVVGSDGTLYKCTVELDYHDRNIVGRLHPDGSMDLDWRKMALWCETDGMNPGVKCSTCWFSPSCQGAVCPKAWMDDNDCQCPPVKQTIQDTLTFVRADSIKFGRPGTDAPMQCGR
jgi:uncharacterized protein